MTTYTKEAEERELERRLAILEDPNNQGEDFGTVDWVWLFVLGVGFPAVLLIWGWF